MSIIGIIITGLGAIARFVMPGKQPMGWILTGALGIGGSLVASYAGQLLGWYTAGSGAGYIASVVGALILLFVVGKVRSGSTST
jgi:uncharacterized membrane protein YeaQ/YmgE (transglycosylase-associated protein family)